MNDYPFNAPLGSPLHSASESQLKALECFLPCCVTEHQYFGPAYSPTSDRLAAPMGWSGLAHKRKIRVFKPQCLGIADVVGTSVQGNAAWAEPVNKFYFGRTGGGGDELAFSMDPITLETTMVGGFPTECQAGSNCLWIPTEEKVWVRLFPTGGSNKHFGVIDPTDNSVQTIDSADLDNIRGRFAFCPSNNAVYVATFDRVVKIDASSHAITTVLDINTNATWTGFRAQDLVYISSIDRLWIWVEIRSPATLNSFEDFTLVIDPATDTIVGSGSGTGGSAYYSEEFDLLLISTTNSFGNPTGFTVSEPSSPAILKGMPDVLIGDGVYVSSRDKICIQVRALDGRRCLKYFSEEDLTT